MTKDCEKVLKILYKLHSKHKNPHTVMELIQEFPPKKQGKIGIALDDILPYLKQNGFLTYFPADDTFFDIKLTCQGINYIENRIKEWLSQNLLAILAFIVSIIALFN